MSDAEEPNELPPIVVPLRFAAAARKIFGSTRIIVSKRIPMPRPHRLTVSLVILFLIAPASAWVQGSTH